MKKVCIVCGGDPKILGDFYKHERCVDGHRNQCKECYKKRVRGKRKKGTKEQYLIDKQRRIYESGGKL